MVIFPVIIYNQLLQQGIYQKGGDIYAKKVVFGSEAAGDTL